MRPLSVDVDLDRYVDWLSDRETTKYLDVRHTMVDRLYVCSWIEAMVESTADAVFGLFLDETFIGTSRIGPINLTSQEAYIGLLIGSPAVRGKGLGRRVITDLSRWAIEDLSLNAIWAGIHPRNLSSIRAFLAAGYTRVDDHRLWPATGNRWTHRTVAVTFPRRLFGGYKDMDLG